MRCLSGWIAWMSMPLWVLACVIWASAAQASQFGCKGLASHKETPVIEGKDGVFFRILSDLRMDHRVSPQAIASLAELSAALAEHGTQLVYLPVPTKALAMPQTLPPEAALYGYNPALAKGRFEALISQMEAAGVVAVNAAPQMAALQADTPPFFGADFHWTSFGARAAAQAVANRLRALPAYHDIEISTYVSHPKGAQTAFSGLRRLLQLSCHDALPKVETMAFGTEKQSDEVGSIDLFAGPESPRVALVGTSFSDSDLSNLAGFLSEATGLDVVNYALTGGNQFGAIQDYLTSRSFHDERPAFLIWENPIYNSLTRFGDRPMRELIAAARGGCTEELARVDKLGLTFALPESLSAKDTLLLDLRQSAERRVTFRFVFANGETRRRTIQRSERQTPTGRFFIPLTGFGATGPTVLQIEPALSDPETARVFVCPSQNRRS